MRPMIWRARTTGSRADSGYGSPRGSVTCLLAGVLACVGVTLGARRLDAAHVMSRIDRSAEQPSPRWAAIARALGREGHVEDGYYRVTFPRSDLTVHIGEQTLAPAFEMTSYFAFAPANGGRVLCMGELVLRDTEVHSVMEEARRQGVDIPALHNHLIGQSPPILYIHVMAIGEPAAIGQKLRHLLERTGTPLGPAPKQEQGPASTWAAVSSVLGQPEEVARETAEWVFRRRDRITEGGVAVKSTGALETASEVVFQQLARGRVATTGELFLAPDEITPVTDALEAGGIGVTAIHHHMVHETPRLYWLHWYATGDAAALARTIRTAIAHTNSIARRAGEKEK